MPEKAKNETNLQQRVSLRITFPKIILIQSDTKAIKIMFPAAKNDWAKNSRKTAKKNLQQWISLHITLSQMVTLQTDNKALKVLFSATKND